jgi:hypothetical protein
VHNPVTDGFDPRRVEVRAVVGEHLVYEAQPLCVVDDGSATLESLAAEAVYDASIRLADLLHQAGGHSGAGHRIDQLVFDRRRSRVENED